MRRLLDDTGQFSSRWYEFRRKSSLLCTPPRLSEVSPTSPTKLFQCSSDRRWPTLVLSRKIARTQLLRMPTNFIGSLSALLLSVKIQAPFLLSLPHTTQRMANTSGRGKVHVSVHPELGLTPSTARHWLFCDGLITRTGLKIDSSWCIQ